MSIEQKSNWRIEGRCTEVVGADVSAMEGMQVLRYVLFHSAQCHVIPPPGAGVTTGQV